MVWYNDSETLSGMHVCKAIKIKIIMSFHTLNKMK